MSRLHCGNAAFIGVVAVALTAGAALSRAPEGPRADGGATPGPVGPKAAERANAEPAKGGADDALTGPWRAAEHVPADVTLFLHVEDGAAIRRELASRPIAAWFNETLAAGEAGRVWSQVAKAAAVDEGALFDALLGRRMTLVVRSEKSEVRSQRSEVAGEKSDDRAEGLTSDLWSLTSEWALVTEVSAETAEKALAALQPVALAPRWRMAMLELPEHQLIMARRGDVLLIGPKDDRGLFRQVLRAIGGRERHEGRTLAATLAERVPESKRQAGAQPSIVLYLRHDPPLGGHSLAMAEFGQSAACGVPRAKSSPAPGAQRAALSTEHADIIVRHLGSFDAPPFTRGVTRSAVDCSVLDAFNGSALIAMVEPNDAGRSGLELFLHSIVGEGLLSPKMRANLGERRIVVIGTAEPRPDDMDAGGGDSPQKRGQPEEKPREERRFVREGMHVPSIAVCYELKKTDDAADQLDRQMLSFSVRLNRLDAAHVDGSAEAKEFPCGRPRSVEVPAAAKVIDDVSLNWVYVAETSHGSGGWYVISSHPDQLDEIVSTLSRPAFVGKRSEVRDQKFAVGDQRPDDRIEGLTSDLCPLTSVPSPGLHSAGVAHGPRLIQLLRGLREWAPLLADDDDHREELRESLRLLSDLAAGLEHVRWRLLRPSANEIDLEVRIRLAE